MTENDSAMVNAVRTCPLVGSGSCSTIDECVDDQDLLEALHDDDVTTPTGALKWARDYEQFRLEMALDARWGEDCDPQLKRLDNFKQKRSELEGVLDER